MKIVLVLLVILGLAGVALWQTGTLDSGISTDTISGGTFTVKRGDLSITLTERGTLKTRNAAQVRSQVEGRTPIQWLADEGKAVKQGDVVIELDRTETEQSVEERRNLIIQLESEEKAARTEELIQREQNQTGLEKADLNLEVARAELAKLLEGDIPTEERRLELAIITARSESERAEARFKEMPTMQEKGFITADQFEDERIKLRRAQEALVTAEQEKELYLKYKKPLDIRQKEASVTEAEGGVLRATNQAEARLEGKKAHVSQKERRLNRERLKLEEDLAEITAQLSIYTGVVSHKGINGQAIAVLAIRDPETESYRVYDYRFPDSNGLFSFQAENGDYRLLAFVDQNRDFIFQPGEPAFELEQAPEINRLGADSKSWRISQLPITKSSQLRTPDLHINVSSAGLSAIERTATTMGVVIDFANPHFGAQAISWGMWEPARWFTEVGYGFYLLEPWGQDERPLLILVHGINSSPKEFQTLLKKVDTSAYRVGLFHYPSGLSIDDNSYILSQIINEMLIRAPGQEYILVAHSMGGLLSKRVIHMQGRAQQLLPLKHFVSISTPWLGHKSAESGVEHSPVKVPVWQDMAPSSRFIKLLGKYQIPEHVGYSLLFSHEGNSLLQGEPNDGSVSIRSMLDPRMQDRADDVFGIDADHVGIMSHRRTMDKIESVLDRYDGAE